MEHRHNPPGRLRRLLERGLLYAAQTVAGREAVEWPFEDARDGAAVLQPSGAVRSRPPAVTCWPRVAPVATLGAARWTARRAPRKSHGNL